MSLASTLRATPALARAALLSSIAYRAELFVWILSTSLPLVMMALFGAVAREGPLGRYDERGFVFYFLATFVVRQATGSWVSWQLIEEIRDGKLSGRLMRPVSPIASYAIENLAATPLRLAVSLPLAAAAMLWASPGRLPSGLAAWAAVALSLLGAWLITFFSHLLLGCASFHVESSHSLINLWLMLFLTLSGYTIPVDLFPPWLSGANAYLPFRYQLALPVELVTSAISPQEALPLLARQWAAVVALGAAAVAAFRLGLRRFAAYGG